MKAYYEKLIYQQNIPLRVYKHHSFKFHAHWHSDIELVYVCEGTLRIGINQDIRMLGKGELAICSSGDIHFFDSTNLEPIFYIFIFKPILIGCYSNWPEEIRFKSAFINRTMLVENGVDPSVLNRVEELFACVYGEMKSCRPYYHMFAAGKLTELCAICQRFFPSSPVNVKQENKRMASIKVMQEILHYLESNYMNPLTLAQTAKYFNLSSSYFCRLFQSLTGTNFKHYLNSIRAHHAEERIKASGDYITGIALECGFDSIRTFNRVFKELRGYTPSSLRSQAGK